MGAAASNMTTVPQDEASATCREVQVDHWVQCDKCDKWRAVSSEISDTFDVRCTPQSWFQSNKLEAKSRHPSQANDSKTQRDVT